MKKAFTELNELELHWLGGTSKTGGRVVAIDIQEGCPHQCAICGVSSKPKSGNMNWSYYMTISDSILNVLAKKKIDILIKDRIDPFYSSDPVYYHSKDGDKEKTLYDIVQDLTKRHTKDVTITTAGWKPGNTYMQRAMEQIVANYDSAEPSALITYSLKAVSKAIRAEYEKFLKEQVGKHNNIAPMHLEFIKNSMQIRYMIQNLKTLAPLNKPSVVGYEIQALSYNNILRLNSVNEKYEYLFSDTFIKIVEKYVAVDWIKNTPLSESGKKYSRPLFDRRAFAGVGNVLNIGDIELSHTVQKNHHIIKHNEGIDENAYFVQINKQGQLIIYYGARHEISAIEVPKEHFIILARQAQTKRKREEYTMLAGLQGKNLLQ